MHKKDEMIMTISDEQARTFALCVAGDIAAYIESHRSEYDTWFAENGTFA